MCQQLYDAFPDDAVYDDRSERAGVKFNDADLMGYPWQAVVGPRGAAAGKVELKRRATGEKVELSLEDAIARILKAGKAPGILTPDEKLAQHYIDLGAVFVAVGLDTNLLMRHTTSLAARFKSAAQPADATGKVY